MRVLEVAQRRHRAERRVHDHHDAPADGHPLAPLERAGGEDEPDSRRPPTDGDDGRPERGQPVAGIYFSDRPISAAVPAQGQRDAPAQTAHPRDVLAGLLVAPLRRRTEPVDDLELRLAQLLGGVADQSLELGVDHRDPAALAAVHPGARGDGAHRADSQRDERCDDRDDQAVDEREVTQACVGGGERNRRQGGQTERPVRPAAGTARPSSRTAASPRSHGASRSGTSLEDRPDRVGLDLGAGHQLVRGHRRGVHVLERRGGGAHDDDLAEPPRCGRTCPP